MSQIKISALPLINQATLDDVFIINDRNLTTSHITWANIVRTIERTNLNFVSSVAFDGNTRIGDFTYYSQEHLRKYPGILITTEQQANWDESYSWGNHADAGYLDGSYVPPQSDYAETDTSVPTFIRNKPRLDIDGNGNLTNVNVNLDYVALLSSGIVTNDRGTNSTIPGATSTRAGLLTVGQFAKLDSTELGAQRNVQSNWDEVDVTSDAYILNKPSIDRDANGNITNVDVAVDYTPSAGDGTITVSSGIISDTATVNVVDDTNAGLMTSDQKGNLEILSGLIDGSGNIEIDYNDLINLPNIIIDGDGNVSNIKVDLNYTAGTTNGVVSNTKGDDATILGATAARAGLISATDYDKLANIEDGAEANVDPTQSFAQNTGAGVLTLQPGGDTTDIPVATTALAGLYPPGHFNRVEGVEDGAQANVQSDWDQADDTQDDYIKNKPFVPAELDDLTDVTTGSPGGGDVLMYNGVAWVSAGLGNTINYGGVHDFIDSAPPTVATDPTVYIHLGANAVAGNVGGDAGYVNIIGDDIKDGDRVLYDPGNALAPWVIITGITDTPQTNLAYNQTTHVVSNDNGTGFTIPLADAATDGLITKADFTKLGGIEDGAEANVDPSQTYTDTTRTLELSPGGDTTVLPLATDTIDGLMSATDYDKLANIEEGAEANVDPSQAYTSATDKGTLTLTPGGDTTELPLVGTDAGLMAPGDKTKLDGITVDANGNITNVNTSLGYTPAENQGTVTDTTSDTDAVIPLAGTVDVAPGTQNNAGLMTAEQSAAVDDLIANPPSGVTDLGYVPAAAGGTVESSTGTNAILTLAGQEVNSVKVAGLMIADDKNKIDQIVFNNDGSVDINGGTFHPGKPPKPDWNADSTNDDGILNKPLLIDSSVTYGAYVTRDSKNPNATPGECPGMYCNRLDGGIIELTNTTINTETGLTTDTTNVEIVIPIANDEDDGLMSAMDKKKYDAYNDKINSKADDCPKEVDKYWAREYYVDYWGFDAYRWTRTIPYDFTTLPAL